jgi:hypothetical protein
VSGWSASLCGLQLDAVGHIHRFCIKGYSWYSDEH